LENELAVLLVDLAEQMAELFEKNGVFTGGSPKIFVRGLPDAEMEGFGWFLALVKELIEGDFESLSQFFESFDGGDGVAVLDSGEIGAKKAGTLFDVTLREVFLLAQFAEPLT